MRVGPFELGEPLGEGAMGRVFAATHVRSGFPLAVKFMTHQSHHAAFAHEVQAVAALDHPHVVWVLDHGVNERGVPWLAMQRATGTLLDEIGAPWERVRRALFYLLDALAHAHARGIVHGDLKPANVLLGCRRDPRAPLADAVEGLALADFGLARTGDGGPSGGTPGFMPPEQRDQGTVGPWSDLYAAGATAWTLLTGAPPVPGAPFVPHCPVPQGLLEWITRLTEPVPALRYQRAAVALHHLAALPEAHEARATERSAGISVSTAHLSTQVVWGAVDLQPRPASSSPDESGTSSPPMGVEQLPVPEDWRAPTYPWPEVAMVDAGLALLPFRTLPLVGRIEERTELWRALRDVAETAAAHAVQLHGASGIGRRRLARWVTERAHELGVADVSVNPAQTPTQGRHVVLLERPTVRDVLRVQRHLERQALEQTAVLWVLAGGPELHDERARHIRLGPLPAHRQEALVRAALPLEPGLSADVAVVTRGIPGAVVNAVRTLVLDDALCPTADGFVLRPSYVLPGAVADEELPPEERLDLWIAEARERSALGDRRGAGRVARKAWEVVESLDIPESDPRHVRTLAALVSGGAGSRTPAAFRELTDTLVRCAEAGGFPQEEVAGRYQLAMLLIDEADTQEQADQQLLRVVSLAEQHGLTEMAVKSRYQLGYNRLLEGELGEAEVLFRRCLDAPHASGPHFGGMGMCDLLLRRAEGEAALSYAHKAVEARYPGRAHEAAGTLGCALIDLGRPSEAEPWMRTALERAREFGSTPYESQMLLNLGCIYDQLGSESEAEVHFLQALASTRLTGRSDLLVRLNLASLYARRSRWKELLQTLDPVNNRRSDRPEVELYHGLLHAIGVCGSGGNPAASLARCERALSATHRVTAECQTAAEQLAALLQDGPDAARAKAVLAGIREAKDGKTSTT